MLSLQHLKGMQNIFLVCLLLKQEGRDDKKKKRKEILRLLMPFKPSYFFILHKTLLRIRSEYTNLFSKSDGLSRFCYESSFARNVALRDPKVNAESCHSGHLCQNNDQTNCCSQSINLVQVMFSRSAHSLVPKCC